jgi:GTPase SAR1 family protein
MQPLNSKPLIQFDGTKLKLVADNLPTTPVKIISIIGKARMGKSSFLNALVSKYRQENYNIFTTQQGIEHCTLGIDYCYIPEKNIMILDSQGLAHGDARHDPALLLFIYLVSNVIVFNDSRMLQNEALRLIEPICTFTQYIDLDTYEKPTLVFRISDGDEIKDATQNLMNAMAHHEDQYNSIRESIENVFASPLTLLTTDTPSKEERKFLASHEYLELLSRKDNLFDSAITEIMTMVEGLDIRNDIIAKIPEFVSSINNNEQIKIEKLDIVSLTHNNDILQWLNKVPAELKTDIKVDGTQATYEQNVVTRQAAVKKIKTEFTKKFKAVSDTIKKPHKAALDSQLDTPIEKAKAECERLAMNILKSNNLTGLEKEQPLGNIHDAGIRKDDTSLLQTYLGPYQQFLKACASVYEPIRTAYEKWVSDINSEMLKGVEKARKNSAAQREKVEDYANELLGSFDDWVTEQIAMMEDPKILLETNSSIMASWRKQKIVELETFICDTVKKEDLYLTISSGRLAYSRVFATTPVTPSYQLVSDIYQSFLISLQDLPTKDILDILIERKEKLLENKLLPSVDIAGKICSANPEIQFTFDEHLLESIVYDTENNSFNKSKIPYMSQRTWKNSYEPLFTKAIDRLIADGMCAKDDTYKNYVSTSKKTMYQDIVYRAMLSEMEKEYCRLIVKWAVFPELLVMN